MQSSANNFEVVQASNSTVVQRFEINNSFEAKRARNKAVKIANQKRTTRQVKRGQWTGEL